MRKKEEKWRITNIKMQRVIIKMLPFSKMTAWRWSSYLYFSYPLDKYLSCLLAHNDLKHGIIIPGSSLIRLRFQYLWPKTTFWEQSHFHLDTIMFSASNTIILSDVTFIITCYFMLSDFTAQGGKLPSTFYIIGQEHNSDAFGILAL